MGKLMIALAGSAAVALVALGTAFARGPSPVHVPSAACSAAPLGTRQVEGARGP